MLANLYNPFTDQKSLDQFSFNNLDEHRKIVSAARVRYNVSLPLYVIDPLPQWDFPAWAYRHQFMHNAQNQLLGIAGNDLTTLDFSRQDEIDSWIALHAQEHYQANSILGIS